MKHITTKILTVLMALTALVSCSDDKETIYLSGFEASKLVASSSEVILSTDNSSQVVLSLAWQNPTLLSSDANKPGATTTSNTSVTGIISTTLQVSASADFATCEETVVTNVSKAFTGNDLNVTATALGLEIEKASPLYFRIKSQQGNNMEAAYSNVCQVMVTPFRIYMNTLTVLDTEKSKTLATLYSPYETGIYSGYMTATSWLNCWFKDNNGVCYGTDEKSGKIFTLSTSASAWNIWFPGVTGIWEVVVNTNQSSWHATVINGMTANGTPMTYDSSKQGWVGVVDIAQDGSLLAISATGARYDLATGSDDAAAHDTTLVYTLSDGVMEGAATAKGTTVAKAGTYTVTVTTGDNGNLAYTLESGDQTTPEPVASNTLCMFSTDGTTLKAVMTETASGSNIYTCKYTPTSWENFKFIFVGESKDDKLTWYGSSATLGQYALDSSDGAWNIWFNDEDGTTEKTVTADLNTMTWKYE